jgi:hypothetical protein
VQSKLEDSSPPEGHRSKQNKRRLSEEADEIEELGPMDFMSAKQKLVSDLHCYLSNENLSLYKRIVALQAFNKLLSLDLASERLYVISFMSWQASWMAN